MAHQKKNLPLLDLYHCLYFHSVMHWADLLGVHQGKGQGARKGLGKYKKRVAKGRGSRERVGNSVSFLHYQLRVLNETT